MNVRAGFVMLEMVVYSAIAMSTVTFFIGVVHCFLHWYGNSKKMLALCSTHHHALMIMAQDILRSESCIAQHNGWLMRGHGLHKNGEYTPWEIWYDSRKAGLYRIKKVWRGAQVIQSSVRLAPQPQHITIEIAADKQSSCITYVIQEGISCQKTVPLLASQ